MLKLSRKIGERIYVYPKEGTENMTVEEFFAGGQISIELSEVKGKQAWITIDADDKLVIVREEISRFNDD